MTLEASRAEALEVPQTPRLDNERLQYLAGTLLNLGTIVQKAATIERVPRYSSGESENIAEHSLMLGILAVEIAQELYPELDLGLVAQFAMVHDLIETETRNGDTPTFAITEEERRAKKEDEERALISLRPKLPDYTRSLLDRYEVKKDPEPEVLFVRKLDKLTPVIVELISEDHSSQALVEDLGVTTVSGFRTQLNKNRQYNKEKLPGFDEIDEIAAHLDSKFLPEFAGYLKEMLKAQEVA